MMIRLTEWATRQGIAYITAFRWSQAGKIPGLHKSVSGRLFVEVEESTGRETVLYGRVSSSDQKADLDRQMDRLRSFAAARGMIVNREVQEIGSGLNGHRKKLIGLLRDPKVSVIVVEHRDRLARFGVEYIEAAIAAQERNILVVNEGEQKLDLVQDFIDVVTSMCSRIYGRRAALNRAKAALAATKVIP
jgi:predicted site-specific integrase-resolvase